MWWCNNCRRFLEDVEVTFDEKHDERLGGCGFPLGDMPEHLVILERRGDFWREKHSERLKELEDLTNYVWELKDKINFLCIERGFN